VTPPPPPPPGGNPGGAPRGGGEPPRPAAGRGGGGGGGGGGVAALFVAVALPCVLVHLPAQCIRGQATQSTRAVQRQMCTLPRRRPMGTASSIEAKPDRGIRQAAPPSPAVRSLRRAPGTRNRHSALTVDHCPNTHAARKLRLRLALSVVRIEPKARTLQPWWRLPLRISTDI